jgi:superoxide dismutase, Fe-Mn family
MKFTLPELPFAKDALIPHISEETLEYHYGKHHTAYYNNLVNLTKGTEFEDMELTDIIKKSQGNILNNASQVFNHTFFWESLSPDGGGSPNGVVLNEITKTFISFNHFKEKFSNAANTLFGSGWVWLVKNESGGLEIMQSQNAGNPLIIGKKPLLTIDVWEHAYYIDYRNARAKFVENFFDIINWHNVHDNYKS